MIRPEPDSRVAQNVLGHTTIRITELHYEHALPEEALRVMRLLKNEDTIQLHTRNARIATVVKNSRK